MSDEALKSLDRSIGTLRDQLSAEQSKQNAQLQLDEFLKLRGELVDAMTSGRAEPISDCPDPASSAQSDSF